MTRTTNARIAGFTFLFYIAAGITSMILFGRVTSGEGIAAKLVGIAQHTTDVGVVIVLYLLQCFSALVLAVTLYAITREQDPDLAMLGMTCRVGEGLLGATGIPSTLGLLWLATPDQMHRTPGRRTRSRRTFFGERWPSPQPSSPRAARSSPTYSCGAE